MENEINRLSDHLNNIIPKIPEILISDFHRERIMEIGNLLPPLYHGAIELQEKPHTSRVDLMVCAFNKFKENDLLKQWSLSKNVKIPTGWEEFYRFCNLWSNKKYLLRNLLDNIYIVFDNPLINYELPDPWYYLSFGNLRLDWEVHWDLFMKCATYLPGNVGKNTGELLKTCFKHLQFPEWIFGFGLLKDRGMDGMRIGLCGFKEIEQIRDYLFRIGWEGDLQELINRTGFMNGQASFYVLSLDLEDDILTRIGIECMPGRPDNWHKSKKVLDAMIENIGYNSSRAEAALSFIGNDEHQTTNGYNIHTELWLDHIKLIYSPSKPLGIKTYLFYNCFKKMN